MLLPDVTNGVDKLNRKYTLVMFLFLALPICHIAGRRLRDENSVRGQIHGGKHHSGHCQ